MTATAPTDNERVDISRFGMFDEEQFAEIVEHSDDTPACSLKDVDAPRCERVATHRANCRSCHQHLGVVCDEHTARIRTEDREFSHTACGAEAPLRELVDVVPL